MAAFVRMVNMDKAEKVVAGLTSKLPLPALDAMGGSMGRFASRKTRRARRDDMDVVLPHLLQDLSRREIEKLIDRNWSYIGRSMLRIGNMPKVVAREPIRVNGFENAAKLQSDGQPIILAFVHLGLWELCVGELAKLKRPPFIIYQAPLSKARTEVALRTRAQGWAARWEQFHGVPPNGPQEELQTFMLEGSRNAVATVLSGLRAGNPAWFAVDECVDGHVHGPWFGKTDRKNGNMSVVARLAAKTGAAIVPCWCIEEQVGYTLNYADPISGDDPETLMKQTADALRPHVEANYEQWFMLHELRPHDFGLARP